VPGFDLSGTVVAVGSAVDGFAVGDEVCGIGRGSAAEYAPAAASKVVPRPLGLDATTAGVLTVSGITALRAVRDVARVQSGQHVLVYGASGGVGTYAVQVARSLGATVTAVCSAAKADVVGGLGADRVIPHDGPVDALDGSTRYDAIIDIAGNRRLRDARRALAPGGTLAFVGVETGGRLTGGFLGRMARVVAYSVIGRRRFRIVPPTERGDDIAMMVDLAARGAVVAHVDRVVGLDGVAGALDDLVAGRVSGKIAVAPNREIRSWERMSR
jgi:NADPH:quinone reductase-like Zn-dependent oxidoreductase